MTWQNKWSGGLCNTVAYKRFRALVLKDGYILCEDWLSENGFYNFYKEMGQPPSDGKYILSRINDAIPYGPGNCRWKAQIGSLSKIYIGFNGTHSDLNKSGVYKLIFPNGMFYIGSTKNFKIRVMLHKSCFIKKVVHNKKLNECAYKYKRFEIEILEECDISEVKKIETKYLVLYKDNSLLINRATDPHSNKGVKWTDKEKAGTRNKLIEHYKNPEANKFWEFSKGRPKKDKKESELMDSRMRALIKINSLVKKEQGTA